jgi:hypothetical protein
MGAAGWRRLGWRAPPPPIERNEIEHLLELLS